MMHETHQTEDARLVRHRLMQPDMEVEIWNYGGIINDVRVKDRSGKLESVVLGFDTLAAYKKHSPYFGAIVGRVAGRIGQARFSIAEQTYHLAENDGENHLHGGTHGFDQVFFDVIEATEQLLHLRTLSPDGCEGYPGNVTVDVIYRLNGTALTLSIEATTDQTTPLNVTNHTYWNLSGNLQRDILDHQLTLPSSTYLPLGPDLLPTGEFRPVDGTVLDFQTGRSIRSGAESESEETVNAGNGYDHPFVLDEGRVQLMDPVSGRTLQVTTNQPVVVLYTGTQLLTDYTVRGVPSRPSLGLCLEAQVHPNAVNESRFPSILIEPGMTYQWETTYRFGVSDVEG